MFVWSIKVQQTQEERSVGTLQSSSVLAILTPFFHLLLQLQAMKHKQLFQKSQKQTFYKRCKCKKRVKEVMKKSHDKEQRKKQN